MAMTDGTVPNVPVAKSTDQFATLMSLLAQVQTPLPVGNIKIL